MVVGTVALAWLGSGLPSHSWAITAAVGLPALGVTVLAMRWPNDPAGGSARIRLATTCWVVLLVAGLLWEFAAFIRQPAWNIANPDFPTLSVLLGPAFEERVVRFAAWLLWLYAGTRLTRPALTSERRRTKPA